MLYNRISNSATYNPGQNYVGQAFFGPNPTPPPPAPPPPHAMLFVRKGLPTSRPTLHPGRGGGGGGGEGGASEYCSNSGKRHFVRHILARIVCTARVCRRTATCAKQMLAKRPSDALTCPLAHLTICSRACRPRSERCLPFPAPEATVVRSCATRTSRDCNFPRSRTRS